MSEGRYLCSDLLRVRLSAREVIVGNLEEISAPGLVVSLDQPVPVESTIEMECVDCPKGPQRCLECRLTGRVTNQYEDPPIGLMATIEFVGGGWSPERWKPRHLFCLESRHPGTKMVDGALEH